jgi:O-acetyl-ADP-ribose deacetylase (regulator of RNase III)
MKLHVMSGDITQVEVDAIVTLINPDGMWWGGVDSAIYRVAGQKYHDIVRIEMNHGALQDGQVVNAYGNRNHYGKFADVIFVVDALQKPLHQLVYGALESAEQHGYTSIAFPLMRTGVMLGAVEKDVKAVVREMRKAFDLFQANYDSNMDIYVVVYDDSEAVRQLQENLQLEG